MVFIFQCEASQAQRAPANDLNKKAFITDSSMPRIYTYDSSASSNLSDLIAEGAPDAYNPLTLANLRLMKEVAQPKHRPEDYDSDLSERIVSKMLTIQTSRSLSTLIQQSELRQSYISAIRTIKRIQERFRYSLQNKGDALTLSRQNEGRKIMELNLDFNLRQGVDPQINFGKYFRMRYDFIANRSMLEFGLEF